MDYATPENFTGKILPGYLSNKALATKEVARSLFEAAVAFSQDGLGIIIFDAYRPVKAVEFFKAWSLQDETNPEIKEKYYPKYNRHDLFELGYLARRSSHSRGAALDLSLYDLRTKKLLDMGGDFDLFDEISHTNSTKIPKIAQKNRLYLLAVMSRFGFKNFDQEWWHFTLRHEPYPDTYFDLDII